LQEHSRHKQSRRFLECVDNNFLTQVLEMMTGAVLLDRNKQGRTFQESRDWGSLGFSDRDMVEFRIMRGEYKGKRRITALEFKRADFRQILV